MQPMRGDPDTERLLSYLVWDKDGVPERDPGPPDECEEDPEDWGWQYADFLWDLSRSDGGVRSGG